MEQAKKSRSAAKAQFTRLNNRITKAIELKEDLEYVEEVFKDLQRAWFNVEAKHEALVELSDDDDEAWIADLDEIFGRTQKQVISIRKDERKILADADIAATEQRKTVARVEAEKRIEEEKSEALNRARRSHDLEEITFKQEATGLAKMLDSEAAQNTGGIKLAQRNFTLHYERCKTAHHALMSLLNDEEAAAEMNWITSIQTLYQQVNMKIGTFLQAQENASLATSSVKLERMKMPTFEGEVREYPRFKDDFMKQVMPQMQNTESAAYALRSCLGKKELDVVKGLEDDVEDMWQRLDEEYGDPATVADTIVNEIKRFTPIADGDKKKFLDFVAVIEGGHRDLKRLSMEREITTTSSVSIIEKRLPPRERERWAELVCRKDSKVDRTNKFPHLLEFLLEKRRAIKYDEAELRDNKDVTTRKATIHHAYRPERKDEPPPGTEKTYRCWIHNSNSHDIAECRHFLSMTSEDKLKMVKENRACWSCLRPGHRSASCKEKHECGENGCSKYHHKILHTTDAKGVGFHSLTQVPEINSDQACLLQLMKIEAKHSSVNVMWDCGASMSFITFDKAKSMKLEGKPVELTLVKVGGESENIKSCKYDLPLIDDSGKTVWFQVYGIKKITTEIQRVNLKKVSHLFPDVKREEIQRPTGQIDVLIGYEYAGYHPIKVQGSGHLLLLSNQFGKCLGGSHPDLKETTRKMIRNAVLIHHATGVRVDDFYKIETMGVECSPKCGNCRCGHCPIGGKDYTIKEEQELKLIEDNLTYKHDHWEAQYPWIKDPAELPDNRTAAMGKLKATERRLAKNPEQAEIYQKQIDDMVSRDVARKLSEEEEVKYRGPIHYISHHEVLRPDSKSTPCRIVFNSSADFRGHVLNDYWAKGPDLLNNLLGVLLRFREEKVAIVGDIKKMYHAVKISLLDQHTHRFLWRDMDTDRDPDTYVISSVSFGDKPSGAIATAALRKTAEMGKSIYPREAQTISKNSYMDDILDSLDNQEKEKTTITNIEDLLKKGNFFIKHWTISGDQTEPLNQDVPDQLAVDGEKVLGIGWDPKEDQFYFKAKLNFSPRRNAQRTGPDLKIDQIPTGVPLALTKRMVLSQINGIYDPFGLAGPFTVKGKILMRRLWSQELKLEWDDLLPKEQRNEWVEFFRELFHMENVTFPRCLKPENAIGNPTLITFSDGSVDAFGSCAYARWALTDGSFSSRLIASKNRLTPLRNISIVKIELSGAVLAKRLKEFIEEESRYEFSARYHIVDSEIVRAMIQKESYGFNTFVATRIGEIQRGTQPTDWYWIEGSMNIADWITRGKSPSEIGSNSEWQIGPTFLERPVEEWPIKTNCSERHLPERNRVVLSVAVQPTESLADRINISRYSKYTKLIRVTARILAMYQRRPKPSLKNVITAPTKEDLDNATLFWIRDAQDQIRQDVQDGKYQRLCPKTLLNGIIIVGGRVERWVEMSYNNHEVILLPHNHRFSRLYAEYIHNEAHLGVAATTSKIRRRFWIPNLQKLVKSIRYRCVICKKLNKELTSQIMSELPEERLKPSPPWYHTGLDLFGPFIIRGEVQKRVRGKAYGVIFNCMSTRAVHADVADNYSTDAFMKVLRKFISLRGCPTKLFSDEGSQLVAANKMLKSINEAWNWDELKSYGAEKGIDWIFSPPDAPWWNGCSEALIKSVKKAITVAVGYQVLTMTELQTVLFEAANLVNERPIGRHPTNPDEGTYLCPNDLLLGRASTRVPAGPFLKTENPRHRFEFVQKIVDAFWKKWTREFFPSLLIRQKWHTERRNLQEDDIVLIQDSGLIRGQWKLGRISKAFPSPDGRVRRVEVIYKNTQTEESPRKATRVQRPVQRLVVVLPVEEQIKNH